MESRVHQKHQKRVEDCLGDLIDEINITVNFLRQLRRHSQESVARLSTLPPHKRLEDLSRVHSFLMKYYEAVTSVNWKFEVMELEGSTDLNFYTNYNREVESFTKNSYSETDEKKYELPQKPFEATINKDEDELMKPPPYSSVVKSPKKSPRLIDFSDPSSDGEVEVKEINKDAKPKTIEFTYLEDVMNKVSANYEGLPPKKESPAEKNENLSEEKKVYEKVIVEEIDEDVRPMKIAYEVNTEYKGFVEHIESPGEFYVHFLTDEIYQFQTMKDVIQSRADEFKVKYPYHDRNANFADRKASAINILGDYGLWYSSCEKLWCRAKITDWKLAAENDLVSIFLFDYGDSKCVSINNLQPLDGSLRKFPMFAQKCHLAGIYPTECKSGEKMKEWNKEESNLFRIFLENEIEGESASDCRFVVAKNDGCHSPDSVPVLIYTKNLKVSVNDELVDMSYAIRLNPPPAPLFIPKKTPPKKSVMPISNEEDCKTVVPYSKDDDFKSWDPMKTDYSSDMNNYEVDTNDPASFIYGHVPKDYERICHVYNRTGTCYKGITCKKEHFRLNPDGYTTDKEEIYSSAFNSLPAFSIGDTISVTVTCIINVNLFYCVNPNLKTNEETLDSLVEFMNQDENILKMKRIAIPPAVGQIVIGKFSGDDMWYRARVLSSCPEADEYELIFLDYGNRETKRLCSIRQIEARYLHLPFQAMRCSLYNVGPHPDVNKKTLFAYFNSIVRDKILRARIVYLTPGAEIQLIVRLFDENYRDIGKELINKNYAIEEKSLIFNEESTIPG